MKFIQQISFFIFLLVICSCSSSKPNEENNREKTVQTRPVKEIVMEGLKRPWSMAFLSNDEAVLAEKDGDLLRVNLSSKTRKIINGFPDDLADSLLIDNSLYPKGTYPMDSDGMKLKFNAGIFEVILDPEFHSNNYVYISYVSEKNKQFATKVIRAKLINDALKNIDTILFAGPYADGLFHFGGGMIFGDDRKLYVTVGERLFGDSLQPAVPIAQNYQDRRGKIYRINSDGSIPEDNPGFGPNAVPGLYAVGIRAAQGLTKDPRTGKIWFSEHGTYQGDELNLLEKGNNYGWPIESTGGYRGGYVPPRMNREFTKPKWSWFKTIAPTGLSFYTGIEFPEWKNNLIIPGLSKGNFWRLVIENDEIISVEELFINHRHRTRKVVQSPKGQLYILTDENNGKIIRIQQTTQSIVK